MNGSLTNRRCPIGRLGALAAAVALAALSACARQEARDRATCTMCGMDAAASKGRFVLDFADGQRFEACSGHCAALIASKQSSQLYRIRVYGYDTAMLIDGRKAFYVIAAKTIPEGSMPPSVFAFSTREAAGRFMEAQGGRAGTLDDVLALAAAKPAKTGRKGHGS